MWLKSEQRTLRQADNEREALKVRNISAGGYRVKVGISHVANGQVAGLGDLASLLAGEGSASFESLLGLNGSEPDLAHRGDEARGKQGDRSKEKENKDASPSDLKGSKSGAGSNSLSLPTATSVSTAPWRLKSRDIRADKDGEGVFRSPLQAPVAGNLTGARPPSSLPGSRTITASEVNPQPTLGENGIEIPPVPALNHSGQAAPMKGALESSDAKETESIASPTEMGAVPAAFDSRSGSPSAVQSSTGLGDSSALPLPRQAGNDQSAATPVVQERAFSGHQIESVGGNQSSTGTGGESSGPRSGAGPANVTPSRGNVGVAPSSNVAGHGQGGEGDPHRGSRDARGASIDSRALISQSPQNGTSQALGPGGLAHGHPTAMNQARPGSIREPASDSQLKELPPSQARDANTARLLASAIRGDLRVGVQTEAFGKVTIQTSAQGGQLSAQLSLENAKEGATLAAHLPGVEQRIVQQHGLTASVRLAGTFDGGAASGFMGHDQSGSSRREPAQYPSSIAMPLQGIGNDSSNQNSDVVVPGIRYLGSSRLDVMV